MPGEATLYDCLGVGFDADRLTLRAAYRRRARELHPDLFAGDAGEHHLAMARLNEAWAVLSNPQRRSRYDAVLRWCPPSPPSAPAPKPAPADPAGTARAPIMLVRKEAWLESVRVRIRFLADMAGRSAVQSMLVRHGGTAREMWEAIVPVIADQLMGDTEDRIRHARRAGAAPLDLANGAALVGLRAFADTLAAQAARFDVAPTGGRDLLVAQAQMVDRMFDALAHELPRHVVRGIGDTPRIARRLGARR